MPSRRPPARTTAPILLLLAALALAGCGDNDSAVPAPTPTATVAPTLTPSPHPTATAVPTGTPSPRATAAPSASPTATPPRLTSADVLARGRFGVGVTTIVFEDFSRPTMANGTYAGTASRTLVTEIWYPTAPTAGAPAAGIRDAALADDGAPFPLLLYAHGFIDSSFGGGFLGRHFASHGYVVAAPTFPLSTGSAPGGPTVTDVPQQPGDLSFLIDELSAPGSRFGGAVDVARIGVTGLSLGALTTTLTALHPTLRDPRIRAAAPVAGLGCSLTPAFYADRSLPYLIVHGDIDAILPFESNARQAFERANAPVVLVTVRGASHTAFSELGALVPGANQDDVGCAALVPVLEADVNATRLPELLGGAAAGIVDAGCPLPCTDPTPRPGALRGPRQLELTLLSVFPFFEATLREDAAMRRFLAEDLARENPELAVESRR